MSFSAQGVEDLALDDLAIAAAEWPYERVYNAVAVPTLREGQTEFSSARATHRHAIEE